MPPGVVSSIVGVPVGAPDSETGGPSPLTSECTYGIDDASIHYTPDDIGFCNQAVAVRADSEGYRTVDGVGDKAAYSRINGLVVFYGSTCIQTFNEHKIDRDASLSADIALAEALHAKL
jgi:hypothetical protein